MKWRKSCDRDLSEGVGTTLRCGERVAGVWGLPGLGGGRCNRTLDPGLGLTPPRGWQGGAGGVDPERIEALLKICFMVIVIKRHYSICSANEIRNKKFAHSLTVRNNF
jgi:hypothetical protein